MILILIIKKKMMLLPSEFSREMSGDCTSKKINAATISAATAMTMPSRLRLLASSALMLASWLGVSFWGSIGAVELMANQLREF